MKVQPITEAEAIPPMLFKRGLYDFEILDAREKVSSKGNDMIELNLVVYDTEGKKRFLYDYLVSSEGMAYKLRHFSAAVGLLPQYEKGELKAADMLGKVGRCQIGIQKDKFGQYPDKNIVSDYVASKLGALPAPPPATVSEEIEDDEIPF
jgi:hypothetical protein